MSNSPGVILQSVDSSFFAKPPSAHPTNVYVVSYKDGSVRSFTGAPSALERRGSRFCYIVDTSEQGTANSCTVQTADDAYVFTVELDVTWKVTDAERVVRAGVSDGNQLVLRYLQDEIWQVSRQFPAHDSTGAESAARTMLARVGELAQGITVLWATARFRADGLTDGRIQLDANALKGQIEAQTLARLQRFDGSTEGAIREHLLRHPEDTKDMLQMLAAGREREQALWVSLFKEALDRGFITDADAQPLRDMLYSGPGRYGPGGPGAGPLSGALPALSLPAGVSVNGPVGGDPGSAEPVRSWVVEDTDASPAADGPGAQAGQPGGAGGTGSAGGVKGWKQLRKPAGQDPR